MNGALPTSVAVVVFLIAAAPLLAILGFAVAWAIAGQPKALELLALPIAGFAVVLGILVRMDPRAEQ